LDEATAKRLFSQLGQAVRHLHALAIVHRDVKAQNILVSSDLSDLRLLDFNTAKCISDGEALTMTGTFLYLPPEVLRSQMSPSKRSDIWSAGLCLHLMIVGHLPFSGHEFQERYAFAAHVEEQTRASLQRPWSASQACVEVLRKTLSLDRNVYLSAEELMALEWLRL